MERDVEVRDAIIVKIELDSVAIDIGRIQGYIGVDDLRVAHRGKEAKRERYEEESFHVVDR